MDSLAGRDAHEEPNSSIALTGGIGQRPTWVMAATLFPVFSILPADCDTK
jgi:hypothetical protein